MKLKICGMKYHENISAIANLQPDFLGFIFYENSPRFFDGTITNVPKETKKVGVFVNATIDEIIDKSNHYRLDLIQLHGAESPDFCYELKKQGFKIIKVFSLDEYFDFNQIKPYETFCDFFLFDTKGKLPGGNGFKFNWEILKRYPSTKPYFLSGGIGLNDIENINEFLKAKESQYCYCMDVNSKFEIESGLKDFEKLKEFKSLL